MENNQEKFKISVEYYKFECGNPYCGIDGCTGHETNIPISITLDNIIFYIEGYLDDYPNDNDPDLPKTKDVKNAVNKLLDIIKKYNNNILGGGD